MSETARAGARAQPQQPGEPAPVGVVVCEARREQRGAVARAPALLRGREVELDRRRRPAEVVAVALRELRQAARRGREPRRARGARRRRATASAAPSKTPSRAARSEPAASSTARMSSIRSSGGGMPSTGSDMPVPRLSNTIRREKDASRRRKRAQRRQLPAQFNVREEPRHEHQIDGPLAHDLVRDRDVAAAGVARLGSGVMSPDLGARQRRAPAASSRSTVAASSPSSAARSNFSRTWPANASRVPGRRTCAGRSGGRRGPGCGPRTGRKSANAIERRGRDREIAAAGEPTRTRCWKSRTMREVEAGEGHGRRAVDERAADDQVDVVEPVAKIAMVVATGNATRRPITATPQQNVRGESRVELRRRAEPAAIGAATTNASHLSCWRSTASGRAGNEAQREQRRCEAQTASEPPRRDRPVEHAVHVDADAGWRALERVSGPGLKRFRQRR